MRSNRLGAMVVASLLPLLGGCLDPQVVGRYSSATCGSMGPDRVPVMRSCRDQILDADVSVVLAPPAGPSVDRTGISLPDQALAAYINVLAQPRMSRDAAALRRNLAEAFRAPGAASPFRDASLTPGVLTVTITNGSVFNPSDRVEQAKVEVVLTGAAFQDWTSARTAYSEIRPGSITGSRQLNLSLSATAKPPEPVPLEVAARGEATARREDTFAPVLQIEDITPRIVRGSNGAGDALVVERNGGLGRDLRGNSQVDVTIRPAGGTVAVEVFRFTPDAGGASLESTLQRVLAEPISAKVAMTYVVRHITSGDATIQDADDHVQFIRASTPTRSVLLADVPDIYGIYRRSDPEGPLLRTSRFPGDRVGTDLCFDREEDAQVFQRHLTRSGARPVGNRILGFFEGGRLAAAPLDSGEGWGIKVGCAGVRRVPPSGGLGTSRSEH